MLIVVRPEPGNAATVAAAREAGLRAVGFPLFEVRARAWSPPAAADFDVLLAGSANAFRHGGDGLGALRALPVHAVGSTTARAAAASGFTVAAVGSGGLQSVLDAIPAGRRVLRLAGEERVRLQPPPGVTMEDVVVYASEPQPLPPALAELLRRPAVIALHSAEAARHLAAECDRLAIDRANLSLATMGPRVTAAAGGGWHAVVHADSPAEVPLLAKAADLCQTRLRE